MLADDKTLTQFASDYGINKDDTDGTADNTEITDVIIICDE